MTRPISRRHLLRSSPVVLAGSIFSAAAAAEVYSAPPRQDLKGPIRLIANENPYGPSASARNAMLAAFDEAHRYAMRENSELEYQIAEAEGVPADHVSVAAGSGEILRMAAVAYGLKGGGVLCATPTFEMLQPYAETVGVEVERVPVDDSYTIDLDALEKRVSNNVGLVYICNPNNPTGTRLDAVRLRDFCQSVSAQALVFVDEAYMELADDFELNSMIDQVRSGKNVIVSRTFSKVHGMAALRVGYGLAPPAVISDLKKYRMSMPNIVSLRAAMASYQDKDFQAFSKAKIVEGRQMIYDVCEELDLGYTPSYGNFVLVDADRSSSDVVKKLRDENVLIRSVRPYETLLRVSVGTTEDMISFQNALRKVIAA